MSSDGPLKILVVESDPAFRSQLREFLEQDEANEYVFQETATIAEAIEAHASWSPDALLVDVTLPDGRGLDLLEALKAQTRSIAMPMVLLCETSGRHIRPEAIAAGAQEVLEKDHVSGDNLCWIVAFAIEKTAMHRALDQRQRELKTFNRKLKKNVKALEREMSVREKAEDAVRASKDRYKSLVVASAQVVWTTDASGLVEDMPDWRALTGQTADEVRGWGWLDAIHPDDRERVVAEWTTSVATRKQYEVEYRIKTLLGEYRLFFVRGVPVFDEQGELREWVGTCTDITDMRRTLELLRQRDEEIVKALDAEREARGIAELASTAKDEFLAVVSHELRAPLNAILGWANILQSKEVSDETLEHAIETIERSARMQSNIIDDLLDSARITRGKLRIDVRPVDLASVVSSAVDVVRPAADAKSVQILTVYDSELDVIITGDADRLQQVLWNLLSNAVKFTPSGGQVVIRLERVDPFVRIQVTDTGRGIKPEYLPFVFDRFNQADGGSTRRQSGLGLGLSLARHLVEAHGGTITVDSDGDGRGSTFTINLPMRAVRGEVSDSPTPRPLPGLTFPPVLASLNILVVDDQEDARELVRELLAGYGATVATAASAQEAIAILEAESARSAFDVLISDIGMPGEDGYSLIRKVRSLSTDSGRHVAAVALTAYGRTIDRVRALSAGFQMHVPKPVDPLELAMVVAALTGRPVPTSDSQ